MFKRMLQAVGIGGPSVDTVLHTEVCRPGDTVTGEVRVGGATDETEIERIVLSLLAEAEVGDDQRTELEFGRHTVAESFSLAAEEYQTIPFSLRLPWETPVTQVRGAPLRGMRLGLRTEAAVAKAIDTSDADPVHVEPLDSQQPVIDAVLGLGGELRSADVEHGRLHGVEQELPFYQEIEFLPPAQFADRLGQVELTFVTRPDSLDVVLEADKRGRMFTPGGDVFGRFHRSHEDAVRTDWRTEISNWLDQVAQRGGGFAAEHHHEHHEHEGHGMGGMLAAGGAGLLGGLALGEMLDGDGMGEMGFGGDMGDDIGGGDAGEE